MKSKSIYIVAILTMMLFACNNNKKIGEALSNQQLENIADNSRTSLDWAGTYEGLLPCADCEGIKTVVTINKDNTYVARESYTGKSDSIFETKGTFKWDEKGQKIIFSGKNNTSYLVGENILIHLDGEGNTISGNLTDKYRLKKVNDQLVGKKWHLVAFIGEEIQPKEAKSERAYIEFNKDFTMNGFTGCNNLRGGYTIEDGLKIQFSNLISTKKFCPEMEIENQFLKTLNIAAFYSFKEHALVMYDKEHTELATFKVAN